MFGAFSSKVEAEKSILQYGVLSLVACKCRLRGGIHEIATLIRATLTGAVVVTASFFGKQDRQKKKKKKKHVFLVNYFQ